MHKQLKLLILVMFAFALVLPFVNATDTGWKNASATGATYNQFSNPANAYLSDNSYATEDRNGEQQDYYNFNLNIPAGSTIDGIAINVEGNDGSFANQGFKVKISWDGGTTWTSTEYNATYPTSTDVVRTLGNSTSLWGRSWSYTDFSNANFRVRLNKTGNDYNTVSLDQIQVNVTYTAGTPSPPVISNVNVSGIMGSSAVINWTTDLASNTTVNYGTTLALLNSSSISNSVTSHSVTLTDLSPYTFYYFNVTSCNGGGLCNTSGIYNFTTNGYYCSGLRNATATGATLNQFTNPTNAYLSDDVRATEDRNGEQQDYYNFSFASIPSGATINGIQVNVEGLNPSSGVQGFIAELSWNNGTSYTSTGYSATWTNSGTDNLNSLGNYTNTWGRTWSNTDFTNANFRLKMNKTGVDYNTVSLDQVQVGVCYTTLNPTATISNVLLNTTYAQNTTIENLQASWSQYGLGNITDWRINNVSIALVNLPFAYGSNSTYTQDYSSYNRQVKVSGATWGSTFGRIDGGYNFSGTSYINITNITRQSNITLEMWVNSPTMTSMSGMLWYRKNSTTVGWQIYISSGTIHVNDGINDFYCSGLTNNNWTHIAITFDRAYISGNKYYNNDWKIFINGMQCGANNLFWSEPGNADSILVGSNLAGSNYNGLMDEVKYYDRVLTPEQIYQNFLAGNRSSAVDTINDKETLTGENWSIAVYSTTDSNVSNVLTSNIINIIPENFSKILNLSIISTSQYLNFTKGNLTTSFSSNNTLGARVINITDWRMNNISLAVVNLPFEGGSSTVYTRDYSSFNRPTRLAFESTISPAWINGTGSECKVGGCYGLDGNSYVQTPLEEWANFTQYSISTWFKVSNPTVNVQEITAKHNYAVNSEYQWFLRWVNTTREVSFALGSQDLSSWTCVITTSTGGSWNTNTWYNVVGKWDGTRIYLYRDGVQLVNGSCNLPYQKNIITTPIRIGYSLAGQGIEKWVDEFKFFNYSISDGLIQQIYSDENSGKGWTTLPSSELKNNQNYSACVTPSDLLGDGYTQCASPLTADIVPPSIFDVRPIVSSNYDTLQTIEISANATDNVAVDSVYANITYPNSTNVLLQLNLITGNKYNASFAIPILIGTYNITFIANDTLNNINNTVKTSFTVSCTDVDSDGFSPIGGACGVIDCNDNNYNVVPPSNNYLINRSITFCSGNYNIISSMNLTSNNIIVSCNDTILDGNYTPSLKMLYLKNRNNATIKNCYIKNSYQAINGETVSSSLILNNTIIDTPYQAIMFGGIGTSSSDNNLIINNTIINSQYGIYASAYTNSNWLVDNNYLENSQYGIYIDGGSAYGSNVQNNIVKNASSYAIEFSTGFGNDAVINNNQIIGGSASYGIYAPPATADNVMIFNNTIINLTSGTAIYDCGSTRINNSIIGNTLTNVARGMNLDCGGLTTSIIENNTLSGITDFGIGHSGTDSPTESHIVRNNNISCSGGTVGYRANANTIYNVLFESNSINGCTNGFISDAGGIKNSLIKMNSFTNGANGIMLSAVSDMNNTFLNNTFIGNTMDINASIAGINNTLIIRNSGNELKYPYTYLKVNDIDNLFINNSIVAVNSSAEQIMNQSAIVSFIVPNCTNVYLFESQGFYTTIANAKPTATSSSLPFTCSGNLMNFTTNHFSTYFADYDTTLPNVTLINPINLTYTNNNTINFTVNVSDNLNLSNTSIFIYNSTNNLVNSTTINVTGTNAVVNWIQNLIEGIYTWFANVFDISGNSATSDNNTLIVDVTQPTINMTTTNGSIFGSTITLNYLVNDNLGLSNFTIRVYNSTNNLAYTNTYYSNATTSSVFTTTDTGILNFTWNMTAYDLAGNSINSETRTFIVDTLTPILWFNNTTPSPTTQKFIEGNLTVYAVLPLDTAKIFLYASNGSLISTLIPVTTPSILQTVYFNFTNLTDGTYYMNASANNSINRIGWTNGTMSFTIYTPTTEQPSSGVQGFVLNTNLTISLSGSNNITGNLNSVISKDITIKNTGYFQNTINLTCDDSQFAESTIGICSHVAFSEDLFTLQPDKTRVIQMKVDLNNLLLQSYTFRIYANEKYETITINVIKESPILKLIKVLSDKATSSYTIPTSRLVSGAMDIPLAKWLVSSFFGLLIALLLLWATASAMPSNKIFQWSVFIIGLIIMPLFILIMIP